MNKKIRTIIFIIFLLSNYLLANEAHTILKKVDQNIRGENIYMKMSMTIYSHGHKRTIKMESWSQGDKKSFVKILYPPRNRGITFLSLNNQMWQYVPKIERIIKIPPSMMLQNWMGSDITNDDMVRQSSIVEDYHSRILNSNGEIVTIELIPKDEVAVVWGKIIIDIDTSTYTNIKDVFYDEDGEKIRIFTYKNVKQFGKYYIPTHWKIQSIDKKENYTQIEIEDVKYDTEISDQYFRKSALKRFSH